MVKPNGVCCARPGRPCRTACACRTSCGAAVLHQINGKCPPKCPPGYVKNFNGFCVPIIVTCPPLQILVNGVCVPKICPPYLCSGRTASASRSSCPQAERGEHQRKACRKVPAAAVPRSGRQVPSEVHHRLLAGLCWSTASASRPASRCARRTRCSNGACIKIPPAFCGPNQVFLNGKCAKLPGPPPPVRTEPDLPERQVRAETDRPDRVRSEPGAPQRPVRLKPIGPIVCGPNRCSSTGSALKPIRRSCAARSGAAQRRCVLKPIGPTCGPNQVLLNGKC